VRDAVFRLPALPATIWLAGIGIILVWHGIGIGMFTARLRRAYAAPAWIRREVRQVARRFGLTQVPETLVIDAQISPLVLSGLQTRLILPSGLWRELDRAGRRAILCHELAHMRRRDHWIRWAEILISTLCWWHPLVWWVRRRIHEEADLSCDAWVTWLMPRGRRAYAEALLRTNAYLSHNGGPMPSVGLGVTSAGAKRFTRRITMVMTNSKRPRCSSASLLLACGLGLTGWAVMPAFSCPPADPPEAPRSTKVEPAAPIVWGAKAPVVVAGEKKAEVYPLPSAPSGISTTGPYLFAPNAPVAGRALTFVAPPALPAGLPPATGSGIGAFFVHGDDDADNADRIRKMERQLAELSKQLSELSRDLGRGPSRAREPRAPRAPRLETRRLPSSDGETIIRSYKLPAGKLKALTQLMVRDDVPILVSPGDDAIEVHATARHQEIFEAFVKMIHPDGASDQVGARSQRDAERAFAAAVDQHARALGDSQNARDRAEEARSRAMMEAIELTEIGRHAEEMDRNADELAEQAEQLQEQAERANDSNQRRALEKQARELERAARQLERKAEALERRAEAADRKSDVAGRASVGDELRAILNDLGSGEAVEELALLDQMPEAFPAIASALRTAAAAIRDDARPEVREAIERAVAGIHSAQPAIREALASYTHADGEWLEDLLAQVADGVDTQVGSISEDTLEHVARLLEEHAAQLERKHEQGR
jgi:hypothetical protein